jgi:hypothetical protein
LHVVRDASDPDLWRIRRQDGSLLPPSHFNIARDGAVTMALGILNRRMECAP